MSFRFEDCKVYKDARDFRKSVKRNIVSKMPRDEKFELASQCRRALDSIVLNIAEGAYRTTDKDFAHFLNQAQTSLNEVVACLDLCSDDGYITNEELNKFNEKAEDLTRQLVSFGRSLKK